MYAPPFRSGRNARASDDCIHCPCRTKAHSFVHPVKKPFDVFILYRTTLISLPGVVQPRWVSGVEPHCGLLAWSAAKSTAFRGRGFGRCLRSMLARVLKAAFLSYNSRLRVGSISRRTKRIAVNGYIIRSTDLAVEFVCRLSFA